MKVAWSLTEKDKFLTYSNNTINLYQTSPTAGKEVSKGNVSLSDTSYAKPLTSLNDIQLLKSVAWYPGETSEHLIAIGQANGKVLLSNFGQNEDSDLVGKEFAPKHLRHCLYLSWNKVHCNLLAEGLDKHRNDYCIAIWDVNSKPSSESMYMSERQRYSSDLTTPINKPFLELGMGETTSSFSWFHKEPKTFVTGMNGKNLRLYDIRDVSKPHVVAHTKYVHGVSTDPLSDIRIASFSENSVSIWDVRTFDKPLLMLPESRAVIKIGWCPTRNGFLAVLCRDSSVVKLYDIRHSMTGTDEFEPVIIERNIQPFRGHAVVHFQWHPTLENKLLSISPTGSLRESQIYEKLCMALSPSMHTTWACGKKILVSDKAFDEQFDIGTKMKKRALKGYGLHIEQPWNNAVVVEDEPHLHALWHFLDLSKALMHKEESDMHSQRHLQTHCIGVEGVLNLDKSERFSDAVDCYWQYPDGTTSNSSEQQPVCQYKSEQRSRALQIAGWWYDRDKGDRRDNLNLLLDSLVLNNVEYERAAAIAIFNLKIGKAIDILSSTAVLQEAPELGTVAMALSGFTEERNALWRQTCCDLRRNLSNPYLRAIFSFLASNKEDYKDVLKREPLMAVKDRVAFACLYLSDTKLNAYLKELVAELTRKGDLDGILLTGLKPDGLDLLQKHVDLTSDVQTASLAAVYSFPNHEIEEDSRVKNWIESYRSLLDQWRLWHQRAKFDIIWHSVDSSRLVPGQAFVSCNFCGKSIACNMTLASRSRPNMNSMLPSTHKPKIACCPGCRKPLPRCALCLTNLGTPSGSALYQQKEKAEFDGKLSSFDSWFTWCQSCRHGGHCSHIKDWFKDHIECPVTGCNCKCTTLDSLSQMTAETQICDT